MTHHQVAPRYDGKVVHYFSDGSGRDNYIWKNNGGLFKERISNPSGFQIGTFESRNGYKPINNYLPAKHVHYPADGTGRDVYIQTDEGGLSKHQWKRSNYINGLRDYDKIRFALPGDLFSQTQFQRPSTATSQRQLNQNTYEQQQRTTNRLSRPKTAKDPYADLKTKQSLKGLRTIY